MTTPRLQEKYKKEVATNLRKKFNLKNVNEVPKLEKIVLNMGVGKASQDSKLIDGAMRDMAVIAGQKGIATAARQAIANFKLREGLKIGVKVTLRKQRMYEFLDRLISVAIPRIKDFRGLSDRAFDKAGNYTMGVTEQVIFPEITADKISHVQGMNITMVFANSNPAKSKEFLEQIGFPFRRN